MSSPLRRLLLSLVLLTTVLSAACSVTSPASKSDDTLKQYEAVIRWSQWDAAQDFLDPEYRAEHPMTQLELNRLDLFRVTQYRVRELLVQEDGTSLRQVVQIKLYNTQRAVERTITDIQDWRYDEASEVWRLHSGLPDVTRRN